MRAVTGLRRVGGVIPDAGQAGRVELHVRYVGDDDPEKCTARRLARFDIARLHDRDRTLPAGVILNPHAERALSPVDRPAALVAVDCSWRSADEGRFAIRGTHRALPFLVAANPINFGRPFALTTAEALAGAVAILGDRDRAAAVLAPLRWGETFLELNAEPLRRYAACADSSEVVAVQADYLADGDG